MRKSKTVPLTLLAAAALTVPPGCDSHPTEVRNCVDNQNHIVSDDRCAHPALYGGGGYHFLYGGRSAGKSGDTVEGGFYEPEAGARIVSSESGVVRGGFGGEAEGGGE